MKNLKNGQRMPEENEQETKDHPVKQIKPPGKGSKSTDDNDADEPSPPDK